jgi:uncharacterized protein involved in exopolysaccharide biosynthesis
MAENQRPFNSNEDGNSSLSLRDIVAPLFRRKRVLLLSFAITFATIVVLGIALPPSYNSQMSILVNRERLDSPVTTEATTEMITASNPVTEEEINSEAELLKSRDVLEQVVAANGLATKSSWMDFLRPNESQQDRVARAVKSLANKLKIDVAIKTDVVNISYSSSDPRLSYGVLKSLGDLYIAKHVAVHHAPGSYVFFDDETQRYARALRQSEDRLLAFNKSEGVAAPDMVRTDLALQLTNAIGQLHSAQQAIAADGQRMGSDEKQMAQTPPRSTTQEISSVPDKLLADLNSALLAAMTKRTQLLMKYNDAYPLVREADQEVADAKAALAHAEQARYLNETTDRDPTFEMLREDEAKTRADLASQRATLTATQRSIQSLQAQMVDLDQKSLQEADLRREAKANEDNYLLYLSKREQARTSDALDRTNIANVAVAVPPSVPVLPSVSLPLIAFAALVLAFFLSISAAYGADYFDSAFHTPSQVMNVLDIPVVVSIGRKRA